MHRRPFLASCRLRHTSGLTPVAVAAALVSSPANALPLPDRPAGVVLIQAEAGGEAEGASDLQATIAEIKARLARQREGAEEQDGGGSGELSRELKSATARIASLTAAMRKLRSDRDEAREEVRSVREQLQTATAALATAGETEQRLAQRIEALENRVVDITAERDLEQARIEELQSQLEKDLADASGQVSDLSAELQQAWADRKAAEEQAQSIAAKLEEAGVELERVANALAAKDAQIAEVTAARDNARAKAAELETEVAELTEAAQASSAEINELGEQLVAALTDREQLEEAVTALDREKAQLEEELTTALAEADENLSEARRFEASYQGERRTRQVLEAELEELRTAADTSVGEVSALGDELIRALTENQELSTALSDLRSSKDLLDEELAAARADADKYAADAAALREQLEAAQANIFAAAGGEGEAHSFAAALTAEDVEAGTAEALLAAQEEIARLTSELAAAEKSAGGDGASEEDVRQLLDIVAQLEARLEESESARTELERQIAGLGAGADLDQVSAEDAGRVLELETVDAGEGWLMTAPEGIVFAAGSDELAPEAGEALAKVAALVALYGSGPVRIVGHTDSFGDPETNRRLSERRASSVREFLVRNFDIEGDRVEVEGMGAGEPIASNDTIEGRRANRRVEVFVKR